MTRTRGFGGVVWTDHGESVFDQSCEDGVTGEGWANSPTDSSDGVGSSLETTRWWFHKGPAFGDEELLLELGGKESPLHGTVSHELDGVRGKKHRF